MLLLWLSLVPLLVSLVPLLCEASIVRTGQCAKFVRGKTNFDKDRYLGQWYEYANVFEIYQDLPFGGKCVRATYSDEGETVGVFNEFVSPVTGYGNIKGSARFADPTDPEKKGELIVGFPFGRRKRAARSLPELPGLTPASTHHMPGLTPASTYHLAPARAQYLPGLPLGRPAWGTPAWSQARQTPAQARTFGGDQPNYTVVETDYTSYVVVYTCGNLGGSLRTESLWLLTRAQIPSLETVQKGESVMRQFGLPIEQLQKTDQTDCSLLPGSQT